MAAANPISIEALSRPPASEEAEDYPRLLDMSRPAAQLAVRAAVKVDELPVVRLPYNVYNAEGKPLLAGLSAEQHAALEAYDPRVTVIDPHRPLPRPGEDVTLRTGILDALDRERPLKYSLDGLNARSALFEDGITTFNVLVRPQLEQELSSLRARHGLNYLRISAGAIIAANIPFWEPVEWIGPYGINEYIPNINTVLAPHYAHHDTEGPLESFGANNLVEVHAATPQLPTDITRRLTVGVQQLRSVVGEQYPASAARVFGVIRAYHPHNVTETMRYGAHSHPGDAAPDRLLGVYITPYPFHGNL